MDLLYFSSIFFTLFFVVDPLGLIPVFILYLDGYDKKTKFKIIFKSILVSIFVSVFFIFLGRFLLRFLGISSGSFLVAGGIILFLISLEMLFGKPSRIKMRYVEESDALEDVSIFPLAMPMLCGPGNIAALLMFSSQAQGSLYRLAVITLLSISVFLIALLCMLFSEHIAKIVGKTGISIIQRLIGLILSAMSVQFFKNGLVIMGVIS
jgi:multiple antibiotic resistance protein